MGVGGSGLVVVVVVVDMGVGVVAALIVGRKGKGQEMQ